MPIFLAEPPPILKTAVKWVSFFDLYCIVDSTKNKLTKSSTEG